MAPLSCFPSSLSSALGLRDCCLLPLLLPWTGNAVPCSAWQERLTCLEWVPSFFFFLACGKGCGPCCRMPLLVLQPGPCFSCFRVLLYALQAEMQRMAAIPGMVQNHIKQEDDMDN